jgi:hypothetical protein
MSAGRFTLYPSNMNDRTTECRRYNDALASVVDLAIAYQQLLGYPQAKLYLMEQAVDQSIIRRVLAFPERRRSIEMQPPLP